MKVRQTEVCPRSQIAFDLLCHPLDDRFRQREIIVFKRVVPDQIILTLRRPGLLLHSGNGSDSIYLGVRHYLTTTSNDGLVTSEYDVTGEICINQHLL